MPDRREPLLEAEREDDHADHLAHRGQAGEAEAEANQEQLIQPQITTNAANARPMAPAPTWSSAT